MMNAATDHTDHSTHGEFARQFLAENPDCVPVDVMHSTGQPLYRPEVLKRYAAWLVERGIGTFEFGVCAGIVAENIAGGIGVAPITWVDDWWMQSVVGNLQ